MSAIERRRFLIERIQQLLDERKKVLAAIVRNDDRPRLRIIDRAFAELAR